MIPVRQVVIRIIGNKLLSKFIVWFEYAMIDNTITRLIERASIGMNNCFIDLNIKTQPIVINKRKLLKIE